MPMQACSIPFSKIFVQFKKLFNDLGYLQTGITVLRLKLAEEKNSSKQIPSERLSIRSATSNSTAKRVCLNSLYVQFIEKWCKFIKQNIRKIQIVGHGGEIMHCVTICTWNEF